MNSYNGFSPQQRMRALYWLKRQVTQGLRTQPTRCDVCGQTAGIIEPHSEDYSAPYGAHTGRWGLCYLCHMILHCRYRAPAAFDRYRTVVEAGGQFPAYLSRNWRAFCAQYLDARQLPEPRYGDGGTGFSALLAEGAAVLQHPAAASSDAPVQLPLFGDTPACRQARPAARHAR